MGLIYRDSVGTVFGDAVEEVVGVFDGNAVRLAVDDVVGNTVGLFDSDAVRFDVDEVVGGVLELPRKDLCWRCGC